MRRVCFFALLALFVPFLAEAQSTKGKKSPTPALSNVPRPAPEFVWSSVSGKVRRLRDLRGQPVVLIFATNPEQNEFKKQVKQITRRYKSLSTRSVLFFVAFTKETGVISRSDVPFVVLPDPLRPSRTSVSSRSRSKEKSRRTARAPRRHSTSQNDKKAT